MHDSGTHKTFMSGAQRDENTDKPRPDLISPFFMMRVGNWLAKGAKKYAARNWERGIPQSRCLESLQRHIQQYMLGDESEDHLAAIGCNAMFLIHNDEAVRNKILPDSLNDLPQYLKSKPETLVDNTVSVAIAVANVDAPSPSIYNPYPTEYRCNRCGELHAYGTMCPKLNDGPLHHGPNDDYIMGRHAPITRTNITSDGNP